MLEEIIEVGEALLLDFERGDDRCVGMVDPFAVSACSFPRFLILDEIDPPGEGAALLRAGLVNGALIVDEEDAMVGAWFVEKRDFFIDWIGVLG